MHDLDSGDGSLGFEEVGNPAEGCRLPIVPQPKVVMAAADCLLPRVGIALVVGSRHTTLHGLAASFTTARTIWIVQARGALGPLGALWAEVFRVQHQLLNGIGITAREICQ